MFFFSASGRTNLELRQKYLIPQGGVTQGGVTQGGVTQTALLTKRPAVSREGSDVRKPMSREGSSETLLNDRKQTTVPRLGHKPNLDVRSSGYGIRREKSSEMKPPSGASKHRGMSNLRPPSASAKVDTGLRRTGARTKQHEDDPGRVRRTASQSSIGSVDDDTPKLRPPTASAKVDTGLRRGARAKKHEDEAGRMQRTASQSSIGSVDDDTSKLRSPTASAKIDTGLRRGARGKKHEDEASRMRRTASNTSIGSVDDDVTKPHRRGGVMSPTSRTGAKTPTKKSVSSSRESLTDAGSTTVRSPSPASSKIPSLRSPSSKPPISKPSGSKTTPGYMKGTTSTRAHSRSTKDKSDGHK